MTLPFWISDAVLISTQASLVALPAASHPPVLRRLYGAAWALVPAGSIAGVVALLGLFPGTADFFTYLALIATPLLAAFALGYIVRGARPAWAWTVLPVLAVAWAEKGSLVGDATALALTALGCLTLGWLLTLLNADVGLIADTLGADRALLEQPNATLNAAAPAGGLPQLQYVAFGSAVMGYGDFFIAGVLAGVLLVEGTPSVPVAVACLVLAAAFDLLFFVTDTLPATVPVALALIVSELVFRRARKRPQARSVGSQAG